MKKITVDVVSCKATLRRTNLALWLIIGSAGFLPLACPSAQAAQTQGEMNLSAAKAFARADAELNRVYAGLLKSLDAKTARKLKTAQLAWLKFRDAECALLASKVEGGSVYPMIYEMRMTELTKKRVKELQASRKFFATEGAL